MSNLIIAFNGMSLIVNAPGRSEALFVDTDKVRSSHHHNHTVKIPGQEIDLNDALVWVEEDGKRLQGSVAVKGEFLALLDQIVANQPLAPELATEDPGAHTGWLDRLAAWIRLPGGELTTAPTATVGGNLAWDFPEEYGQPRVTRRLTQTGFLTRENITGPLRLAVKSLPSGAVTFYDIRPEPGGDYVIRLSTKFVGIPSAVPAAGSTVQLSEMQLLYACLQSGSGPIPSAVWPSTRFLTPPILTSDPVTDICPFAVKHLGT
jgi:hypothetical protein